MTRAEIKATFWVENPEFTKRVITEPQLDVWCEIGDKRICAETRCLIGDFTITSTVTSPVTVYAARYDLTAHESKFYDIDDYPGGGVSYDDEPLKLTSVAKLDEDDSTWRDRSAGDPEEYYRRGEWLYFDRPIETADDEIRVYCVFVSDDFDDDAKTPYNQLIFLEPYHPAILKYLRWQAKQKVGKQQKAMKAELEYTNYVKWMKKMIGGTKISPITFRPATNRYSTGQ